MYPFLELLFVFSSCVSWYGE